MKLGAYLDADWANLHEFAGEAVAKRKWSSNFSARFAPVFFLRVAQRLYEKGYPRFSKVFSLMNVLFFGLEVPARLAIGPGLVLPHPNGTIIGAGKVGKNVIIYQQVTLGASLADFGYNLKLRPTVGDNVKITAGAKILGSVRIGHNATIGANAVVLKDVPDGSVAVGVPARILKEKVQDSDF